MPDPIDPAALAEAFRRALLKGERASAVRLVRAYGLIWQRLQDSIDALGQEVADAAALGKTWDPDKSARLKRLQRQVEQELTRYAVIIEDEMDAGARQAIGMAQQHAKALTQAQLGGVRAIDAGIMSTWQSLNPDAVVALLAFLAPDSSLRQGLRTIYGPATAQVITDRLAEGIALGYGPRKTAGKVREAMVGGKYRDMVKQVGQQEMGRALDSALRISRTAQLNAYRESTRAAYVANKAIVPKWRWTCAKQANTCMSCIAMDGQLFDSEDAMHDHWNGRCAMVPVPIDYKDLGLDVPPTPRPQWESGADWYARQPESVQRQMMGPKKYTAYREGKFSLADLSQEVDDPVWGRMRTETPLKELTSER